MEVDRRIARIIQRLVPWRSSLGRRLSRPGSGFDQLPVDGEMLVAQQAQPISLTHHLVREALRDVML
jgi:hypothetical protein